MRAVLGAARDAASRIVTNMGAANPIGAAQKTVGDRARARPRAGCKVAAVDRRRRARARPAAATTASRRPARRCAELGDRIVSANAYLGVGADRATALRAGRRRRRSPAAPPIPALFMAPLVHEFGWSMDDWARLGQGDRRRPPARVRRAGHRRLLRRPRLQGRARPGAARLSDRRGRRRWRRRRSPRWRGSGGCVTAATCKEQLLYEIHDPRALPAARRGRRLLARSRIEEIGADRVRVAAAAARRRPATLKVSVGYVDGYIGEGQISYAGPGRRGARAARARDRARAPAR